MENKHTGPIILNLNAYNDDGSVPECGPFTRPVAVPYHGVVQIVAYATDLVLLNRSGVDITDAIAKLDEALETYGAVP